MAELEKFEDWYVDSSYQEFVKREGAPLYEGSALEDLASLELADWKRRGGKVAYTRLGDQEDHNLQVIEIPPGGELRPEHHMYEAIMYVKLGRGTTAIWQEGEPKHTVEWQASKTKASIGTCGYSRPISSTTSGVSSWTPIRSGATGRPS